MPIKNKSLADLPVFQTGSQDIVGGTCVRLSQYPDGIKEGWIERLKLERTFVCVEDLRDVAIQGCNELQRDMDEREKSRTLTSDFAIKNMAQRQGLISFFSIKREELE